MTSFVCTSRCIAMSAAILGSLALPTVVTADPSGQARPSLHTNIVPATTKGSCVGEKQAFASSSVQQSTTSETNVNLVGATLKPTITQGCLVVDFTGESYAAGLNIVYVQVLLDGAPMTPGEVQLSGNDDTSNACCSRSHAFSFVATGLSSGPHTIQVQFSDYDNSSISYINDYTLVAHYD